MKKKLEPIVISQELDKTAALYSGIEEGLPLLQSVWEVWRRIKFYDPKVELSFLLTNHQSLKDQFKTKLISELPLLNPAIPELKHDKSKYIVDTPELDQAIAQAQAHFAKTVANISYFSIQNDKVVINQEKVQKYADRYTLKAESEKELYIVKKFEEFGAISNEINEYLKENRLDMMFLHKLHPIQIARWLVMDDEEKHSINPTTFRRIKKKLAQLEPVEEEK